jgi:hypothetical protein
LAAGAHPASHAGAGAQQEAAAPLQSLLRPKIPADALVEVAIEHPTIAKAMINRRILHLQKTKGYTTTSATDSLATRSIPSCADRLQTRQTMSTHIPLHTGFHITLLKRTYKAKFTQ